MRITKKTLAELLNAVLIEKDLSYHLTVHDIAPTRYRPDQYAEGASKLSIMAQPIQNANLGPLPIFSAYTMYELTELLKDSQKTIVLKTKEFTHIDDLWIEVV